MATNRGLSRNGNAGKDEYYTPPELFNALGLTFDLDVCAPEGGVPWVPASRHYSKIDDGLTSPWGGRVWMNPPYSNPEPWVDKWLEHGEGVAVLPTSQAKWFRKLWDSPAVSAHPTFRSMYYFIHQGKRAHIWLPVLVWAVGESEIQALANVGKVR